MDNASVRERNMTFYAAMNGKKRQRFACLKKKTKKKYLVISSKSAMNQMPYAECIYLEQKNYAINNGGIEHSKPGQETATEGFGRNN